jgi:CDP-paratose 2-epimerase
VLVTGGAGFIGTNLVFRLLCAGFDVVVLDDFSRSGVEHNADWLAQLDSPRLRIVRGDVRDPRAVEACVQGSSRVFHFAAQVAVTTSLSDPLLDFETNARGTLNVLEAIRRQQRVPSLVFTSTNKVYGALPDVSLEKRVTRYAPSDPAFAAGVSERQPLDFHSPYGCSKGAADQYVRDYARCFDLPAVVFRMSCIYGPHQCGNEDQGWLAHFVLAALKQAPLSLYGDGLQVRDVLFVEDLLDALCLASERAEALAGRAFNIGGGPANTVSLLEALERIRSLVGRSPVLSWRAPRVGDQKYYVSNTEAFTEATGWTAKTSLDAGLERLARWLREGALDIGGRTAVQPQIRNAVGA